MAESSNKLDPKSFAATSNMLTSSSFAVYTTTADGSPALAEISLSGGSWDSPKLINPDSEPNAGKNFDVCYDPNNATLAYEQRCIFFSGNGGDGKLYMRHSQLSNPGWTPYAVLKDEGGYPFASYPNSKIAVTHYIRSGQGGQFLLYVIGQNNTLVEWVGTFGAGPGDYRWVQTKQIYNSVSSSGYLSVVQDGVMTYVLFQDYNGALYLATGDRSSAEVVWRTERIKEESEIIKLSPLAIAARVAGGVTAFYLQQEGSVPALYGQYIPTQGSRPRAQRVGTLEPSSVIAATSFRESGAIDTRVFTVSTLDTDRVLLERVQKRPTARAPGNWVLFSTVPTEIVKE